MYNAETFVIYFSVKILFVHMRKQKQCLKDMHFVL